MRANFALKSGRDEWTRTTDPHLIREVNLFAWVYKKVLEFPKNQAFWHIENEIDVNEKYTPDIN